LRGPKSLEDQGVPSKGAQLLLAASARLQAFCPPPREAPSTGSSAHAATGSVPASSSATVPSAFQPSVEAPSNNDNSAQATNSPGKLSVFELKQRLKDLGVSYEGCTEKSELVELLRKHQMEGCGGSASVPEGPDLPPAASQTAAGEARSEVPWASIPGMSQANGMPPFDGMGFNVFSTTPNMGSGQQVNPMAMFLQQLGPIVGNAMGNVMNQAFAQVQPMQAHAEFQQQFCSHNHSSRLLLSFLLSRHLRYEYA